MSETARPYFCHRCGKKAAHPTEAHPPPTSPLPPPTRADRRPR
jgi:hypothetical protein